MKLQQILPYEMSDLAGEWQGEANNQKQSVFLHLSVNEEGEVKGSGVTAKWHMDAHGCVRGGGAFAFLRRSDQIVVRGVWQLHMDRAGKTLRGIFHIADAQFNKCQVRLKKI